ncbi:unnamed protein product [Phytophthora fragariaefolia]|uniref:Unnamed protein product n=1 Tax=Phytophthora fragariaefolia TaxID=1490495 RepID=A0A9W6X571_9STRA|nr:unnamed protein product [Phytophthora fragariaefolia]
MTDVDRLLLLIESEHPLSRDAWERLATSFNANRPRGAPERDFESLCRKFKVLYSTRKPTGMPNMPPDIKKVKEVKQAIDDKANAVEMDDEADEDRPIEPDCSFEAEPDDSFYVSGDGNSDGDGDGVQLSNGANSAARLSTDASAGTDESVACESMVSSPPPLGEFQEMLTTALATDGPAYSGHTPRPASLPAPNGTRPSSARRSGMGAPARKRKVTPNAMNGNGPPSVQVVACQNEAEKYPKMHNVSNRLGGQDLTAFRDTVGAKSALEDDKETLEASFAKAKRIRAMRTSTALKTKLASVEGAASSMGGSLLEAILLLREENEHKAEERRAEEEKRRREEIAAREARYLADKANAAEGRHQEKLEREERTRCERDESRARTQELVMLINAIKKNA